MTIAFTNEKNSKLTSQDIYDIIHFAAQSAEDNGFVNQFVFDRALYAYAAIILYPERKAEIGRMISENLLDAWNALLEDGTVEKMYDEFKDELDLLADNGAVWLTDYVKYLQSARGLLSSFQEFSGDIVEATVEKFKHVSDEVGANQVLAIANKWGMNNNPEKDIQEQMNQDKPKFELVEDGIKERMELKKEAEDDPQDEDGPLFEI